MEVDVIMRVAGVGMIVAVVCQILSKAGREEQSTMVSITGIVIILLLVVEEMGLLMESLRRIFGLLVL
jgi:stage III sporulation protein AC